MPRTMRSAARGRLPGTIIRARLTRGLVGLGCMMVMAPGTALADADPPAGAIIYMRDVPTRQAQLPGQPGQPSFVDAGPDEVVLGATRAGGTILTDDQAGAITAPIGRTSDLDGSSLAAVDAGPGLQSHSALGGAGSERSGGMVSGAVGGAVSHVNSALSAITTGLPGPR